MKPLFIRSAAIALSLAAVGAAPASDVFDRPVETKVIRLTDWPFNQPRPKRTCTYYAGFMEKEIDLGEIGADRQSVIPVASGTERPACVAKALGEKYIRADNWQGYFKGAKGEFLFFDGGDGVNGGLPFTVFSAKTGKKLFEDSRQGDRFKSVARTDDALVMRYRRVWPAPCSLMADAKGCWKKVMAATDLPESARPDCSADYRKEMARTPNFGTDIPNIASVIGYNAEARYAGGKLSIKPVAGPTACWLQD